jgi:hypothetical protein
VASQRGRQPTRSHVRAGLLLLVAFASMGACRRPRGPEVVLPGRTAPTLVGAAGGRLFWGEPLATFTFHPEQDAGPVRLTVSLPSTPCAAAAAPGNELIVAGGRGVLALEGQQAWDLGSPGYPDIVTVNRDHVFAGDRGTIIRTPLAGGASQDIYSQRKRTLCLAADDRFVYWAEDATMYPSTTGPHTRLRRRTLLRRVPVGGGAAQTIAEHPDWVHGPVRTSKGLFWFAEGRLWQVRTPWNGAKPEAAVEEPDTIERLTTAGEHDLCWATSRSIRCWRPGGGVRAVVPDAGLVKGLAGDGNYVYWADGGRGALFRARH